MPVIPERMTNRAVVMEMPDMQQMLEKVKDRIGIPKDETANDAVLIQMLEDAVMAITLFCNRNRFPYQLEYIARQMVVKAFDRENGDHVASIKRGDTQITYSSVITEDNLSQEQRDICCKFRRFRVG